MADNDAKENLKLFFSKHIEIKKLLTLKNPNKFPINPRTTKHPLKHIPTSTLYPQWTSLRSISNFDEYYKFNETIYDKRQSTKLVSVTAITPNARTENKPALLCKIYNTDGIPHIVRKPYREFIIVHQLKLIEYHNIFWNDEEKQIYIIMNHYGPNLKSIIQSNGTFQTENDLKIFVTDILDQLWILHNAGYLHGDVKPQNIVKRTYIEEKDGGDVLNGWKLIDYDRMRKIGCKGEYVGTPGWSDPHMKWFRFNGGIIKYDPKSDIFSLALVMLYCLCGKQPFLITEEKENEYGLDIVWNKDNEDDEEKKNAEIRFRDNLYNKMLNNWYIDLCTKGEDMIQNFIVKLYYNGKISMELFEVLRNMVWFTKAKRWDCQKIFDSKWLKDIRK